MAQYDPKGSSTAKSVNCDGEFCTTIFNAPNSDCKEDNLCTFSITYGDGSKTGGYFVQDFIHFNQASGDLKTTFMNGNITFGYIFDLLPYFQLLVFRIQKEDSHIVSHELCFSLYVCFFLLI